MPTGSDPAYSQSSTLEGTTFNLYLAFNTRCSSWYLSVADASGVDIYNGVKLIVGCPLLRKCADPRKPAGELLVFSSTSDDSPPGLLDLLPGSGRCALYYVTSDWASLLTQPGGLDQVLALIAAGQQASTPSSYGQS